MNYQSTNVQSGFQEKVLNFHKEIARKQRQNKIAKKRQQLFRSQQQYPLCSSSLEKYWNLSARQISLSLDSIFDTLDSFNPTLLQQEDHNDLCQDLLYIMTTHPDFSLPYNFQFSKNSSPYTAAVACYSLFTLSDQEINYWMTYMEDETKDMFYLQILCQENNYERWVKNLDFLQEVVRDWGYREDAQTVIIRLLQTIDTNRDQEDFCFYESVWTRIFQMNKNKSIIFTPEMFIIIGMLMDFYMRNIYDPKKKKFHYLRIIFNQSLISIHKKNQHYDLGHQFTRIFSLLTKNACENVIPIFVRQGFIAMSQILMNNFNSNFLNCQSQHYLKKAIKDSDVNNIKTKFIDDVIIICLNYLRYNGSQNVKEQIPKNLLIMLDSQKQPVHQVNFNKLMSINSTLTQKYNINFQTKPSFMSQNPSNYTEKEEQI